MSPLTGLAVGMVLSGQNFYEEQIPNRETGKTHVRPARKTGGGSGEVRIIYEQRRTARICEGTDL
jgi:hypothetical protein